MSEGNGYITRDMLLGATAVRFCEFPIPADFGIAELAGKKIRLKSMTAKEKIAYEEFFIDPKTGQPSKDREALFREKLVIDSVVDASGSRLFTKDDIRALSKVDGAIVQAISEKAVQHNRLDISDTLEKKSEETTDSDSG